MIYHTFLNYSIWDLSTKKRFTTLELWVKFYLGQNEDCSLGSSITDHSERLLQRGSGGRSILRFWWRGSSIPLSTHFTKGFLLVMRIWCHHKGITASLDMRRCKDWGHKICSWNQFTSVAQSCLTLCDPMDCSLFSLLSPFRLVSAFWFFRLQPEASPDSLKMA